MLTMTKKFLLVLFYFLVFHPVAHWQDCYAQTVLVPNTDQVFDVHAYGFHHLISTAAVNTSGSQNFTWTFKTNGNTGISFNVYVAGGSLNSMQFSMLATPDPSITIRNLNGAPEYPCKWAVTSQFGASPVWNYQGGATTSITTTKTFSVNCFASTMTNYQLAIVGVTYVTSPTVDLEEYSYPVAPSFNQPEDPSFDNHYTHVAANSCTQLGNGQFLYSVTVNNIGSGASFVIYDSANCTGSTIASSGTLTAIGSLIYNLNSLSGTLSVLTAGSTPPDLTVSVR